MLLRHERIYTGPEGTHTHALLVREGRVVARGERAIALVMEGEKILRPEGACVMPALMDAHIHLWGVGQREGVTSLRGMASPDLVIEALASAGPAPCGWVLGAGWDQHAWGAGTLSRAALDAIFPDIPVCLHRHDHHAVWANTEALRRAGLLEARSIEGGRVDVDAQGRPTGLLIDEACEPVLEAIPATTEAEDEAVLRRVAAELREVGVVGAHMAWVEPERVAMLERLHRAGDLPIRVHCMIDGMSDRLPALLARGPRRDPDAWLSTASIKFFADGAMGSQGAWMFEPYVGGGDGLSVVSPETLLERVPGLLAQGWQVATHAIGDRAAHEVLRAYAAGTSADRAKTRPRLEHAQIMRAEDIAWMGELGVLASIQPIHMRSDAPWADRVLQPHQLERLFSWRSLADATHLSSGSDFPIDDLNPWHGIATSMTRRGAGGEVFRPDHALTRQEAIAAYTTGAAHAAHWEEVWGQLGPGFLADMIAVDVDPFTASPDEIWETRVLRVWVEGA